MRYIVHGRVQGVFYRASTREQALRLGLKGWVRNLEDGCVEALACGPETQLEVFCDWLWQGPAQADVTDVVVSSAAMPLENDEGFFIR